MKMEKKYSLKVAVKMICICIRKIYNFNKFYIFASVIFTVLSGLSPTILLVLMQNIMNRLQLGIGSFIEIGAYLISYILFDAATSGIGIFYGYLDTKVAAEFSIHIDEELLKKAFDLKLSDYEDSELHNIISRARNEGAGKIMNFFANFLVLAKQIISVTASGAIVSIYKPHLLVVALVLPVLKCLYAFKANKRQYEIIRNRTTRDRKIWYISLLAFTGQAFKEIRLFQLNDYFQKKYVELKKKNLFEDVNFSRRVSKVHFGLGVIENLVNGGIFASFLVEGYKGRILIGDVITYTRCIFNVSSSLESLFSIVGVIAKDCLFVSQYFEFMNIEKQNNGNTTIERIDTIEVKNLFYKYPGSNNYAIKNLSFNLKRGDKLLVVGVNGSGKSTLIKLLLGFYDDYCGTILINGINLRTIDKKSYYSLISGVFQDFTKYEGTVRENISFGDLSQFGNDQKLEYLLAKYGLSHLKIDEVLGNWFDKGKSISGGEWQKVALCRAFIRSADFFVLDEPDAALDSLIENEVLDSYQKAVEKGISIFTSHRFSKVCLFATQIMVLDNGEIKERGTHFELMKKGNLYSKLYRNGQITQNNQL